MPQPTINLSAFLPLVRPYAPGAAIPTITQALRLAAIDFCARTRCWRRKITVDVTRQDYPVIAPGYAEIHEIEHATFDGGYPLRNVPYNEVDPQDFDVEGVPTLITQVAPNEVALVPFMEGELTISVFLKPQQGVFHASTSGPGGTAENWYDSVPEFLLSQHGEAIAAGALSRLLVMPDQPFMNPELAVAMDGRFQRAIDANFAANVTGQQRARPRTRASFF